MKLQIIPGLEEVLAGMRPGGNVPRCLQNFKDNVMRQHIKFLLCSHVGSKMVENVTCVFVLVSKRTHLEKISSGVL